MMVEDRLADMRRSVYRLREFARMEPPDFAADPDAFAIAEHHLRRALECVLDVGRHIVAKKGLGKPVDYSEIFDLLGQQGVLPGGFARKIRGMAGYRNRLVHLYADVTPEELHAVICRHLDDFESFAAHIVSYLDAESKES